MAYLIYYSTKCPHSANILQQLNNIPEARSDFVHYLCVDRREKDEKSKHNFLITDRGSKVLIPDKIERVPALLQMSGDYPVVYGNDIINTFSRNSISAPPPTNNTKDIEVPLEPFTLDQPGTRLFPETQQI